jgi:aminobenzoyl-glutamate utilization protein B
MSIGQRGMVIAAKAMALTGADLYARPQLVADARTEFDRQLAGKKYRSFIPEGRQPPLDYRR